MTRKIKEWLASHRSQAEHWLTIRPIRPSDVNLLTEMHAGLSPASLYARFLQYRQPTPAEIRAICYLSAERGGALVATIQEARERIVGVAYYVREVHTQSQTAEAGILVEDQFQGQGIGRKLWQQLHAHARQNQVRWLRVLFAPDNQRVLHLLQTSGYVYQPQAAYGLREVLVALGESTQRTHRNAYHALQSPCAWDVVSKPLPALSSSWFRRQP